MTNKLIKMQQAPVETMTKYYKCIQGLFVSGTVKREKSVKIGG